MDFLTFVTKVFDTWAWPLVVLSVIAWFRDDVKKLLPSLLSVKGAGFEAIFGKKIEEAGATAVEVEAEAPPQPGAPTIQEAPATHTATPRDPQASIPWENMESLWRRSQILMDVIDRPESTIMTAWKQVERTVLAYVSEVRGKPVAASSSPPLNWLRQFGFTESELDLYKQLRHLRNLIVREKEASVSPKQAREYVKLATTLIVALQNKIATLESERAGAADGASE